MKNKPKKKKDNRLVVGDNLCDMNEYICNLRHPEKGFKIECRFETRPYGGCRYDGCCDLQKEITEEDAEGNPEIVKKEEI